MAVITFSLNNLPTLIDYDKTTISQLIIDDFSEEEKQLIKQFVQIFPKGSVKNPVKLFGYKFNEWGNVERVYSPQVCLITLDDSKCLGIKVEDSVIPIVFKREKGLFFNEHQLIPFFGNEVEITTKEGSRYSFFPCGFSISTGGNKYRFNLNQNRDFPMTEEDEELLQLAALTGDEESYQALLERSAPPSSGVQYYRPYDIPNGLYLVEGHEYKKTNYGDEYHLRLVNVETSQQINSWSCSYYKNNFLVFNSISEKKGVPLYLIVDNKGNGKFNGAFTINSDQYFMTKSLKDDINTAKTKKKTKQKTTPTAMVKNNTEHLKSANIPDEYEQEYDEIPY